MNFVKSPGPNGYKLRTPFDVEFDLGDEEVWRYLGLSNELTLELVRGFPILWTESQREEIVRSNGNDIRRSYRDAEKAAADHRVEAIQRIAHSKELTKYVKSPNPMSELLAYCQEVAVGGPFAQDEVDATDKFLHELTRSSRLYYEKIHRKPLNVPFKFWCEAAVDLFDEIHHGNYKVHPAFILARSKKRTRRKHESPKERGAEMSTQEKLEPFFSASSTVNKVQWGPLFYESSEIEESHFLVAGLTTMGKTTLLLLLFQSIYKAFGAAARFIYYDAKSDLLPKIYPPEFISSNPTQQEIDSYFHILNPFDTRTAGWDIAKDLSDDSHAADFANILFPLSDKPSAHERFFTEMACEFTVAAVDVLRQKAGDQWSFYDLLCALNMANVESVLSSTPRGLEAIENYVRRQGQSGTDALRTLSTETSELRPLAHQWRYAKNKLSLRDWAASGSKSIVVMTGRRNAKPHGRLNRMLLDLLGYYMFQQEGDTMPRTFVYLDEFERLDQLSFIRDMIQQGLSRKIHVAMCIHDLALLRSVYGDLAKGILSQASFNAVLRIENSETARWASDNIGASERFETTTTIYNPNEEDQRQSTTVSPRLHQWVLPDEIRNLPSPKMSGHITGFFRCPLHPSYRGTLVLDEVTNKARAGHIGTLWPRLKAVKAQSPPTTPVLVPADSFFSLHQLGVAKAGYYPPSQEEMSELPDDKDAAEAVPAPTEVPTDKDSKMPKSKRQLKIRPDYRFDFGD